MFALNKQILVIVHNSNTTTWYSIFYQTYINWFVTTESQFVVKVSLDETNFKSCKSCVCCHLVWNDSRVLLTTRNMLTQRFVHTINKVSSILTNFSFCASEIDTKINCSFFLNKHFITYMITNFILLSVL